MNNYFQTPNLKSTDTFDSIWNESYQKFDDLLNPHRNKIFLNNKFVFIDYTYNKKINNYPYSFWHAASLSKEELYNMYPCQNDICYEICPFMCKVNHKNNFLISENRVPCLYRAIRTTWINDIICLANENSSYIKKGLEKKSDGRVKTILRYENDIRDYAIVLENKYLKGSIHNYYLNTGFPVVLKSYKRKFRKLLK